MKYEDNSFSGFKTTISSKSNQCLGEAYYDKIQKPIFVLVAVLCAFFISSCNQLFIYIKDQWEHDGLLFCLLVIMSLFAYLRAYQSICLAKKDYYNLKKDKFDNITFAIMYMFLLGSLLGKTYNHVTLLYATYTMMALCFTINFWNLFHYRLGEAKDSIDYICERKIQFVNVLVFSIVTIIFSVFSITLIMDMNCTKTIYVAMSIVVCILLSVNMIHSHELTNTPKIILKNYDIPSKIVPLHSIKINRVFPTDVYKIAIDLINEFNYIFEYIFDTKDKRLLKHISYTLLSSCFGFGTLGYMSFFCIRTDKNENIGWVKISKNHDCLIYKFCEFFYLPIILLLCYKLNIFKIIKRAYKIAQSQPPIHDREIQLTYFFIKEKYRNKGYGTVAISLLKDAFFNSKTNNISISSLSLLVRSYNYKALTLFQNLNFSTYTPNIKHSEPVEILKIGNATYFRYP